MRTRLGILTTVLAVLYFTQAHEITGRNHRRRQFPGKGNNTVVEPSNQLEKRYSNAAFTYYDAGVSACGGTFTNSDFIVALNAAQFAGGALCFKTISITANGKTASAQIVDMCPGCSYGGLDLSRGLFDFFASESEGVLHGSWTLGGGQPASSSASPTPTPSPTATSSTWSTSWSTSSSTWSTSSTSSHTSSTTSSSSSSNSAVSTTSTSSAASPTETATGGSGIPTGLIEELYTVYIQMARMLLPE